MTRWQYTTDQVQTGGLIGLTIDCEELENRLKAHSLQGWELVSVVPVAGPNGLTAGLLMIFKRPT